MNRILCILIGNLSTSVAKFSVNSCCNLYFSQEKEPAALKKYKRH